MIHKINLNGGKKNKEEITTMKLISEIKKDIAIGPSDVTTNR